MAVWRALAQVGTCNLRAVLVIFHASALADFIRIYSGGCLVIVCLRYIRYTHYTSGVSVAGVVGVADLSDLGGSK